MSRLSLGKVIVAYGERVEGPLLGPKIRRGVLYDVVQYVTLMEDAMPERVPTIQIIKASAARAQWSQLLNGVFRGQTRVIVEKSGIPVAAIVSAQDLERLNPLDEQRKQDLAILNASQVAFKDGQKTSSSVK